jgi:hypothetical protein
MWPNCARTGTQHAAGDGLARPDGLPRSCQRTARMESSDSATAAAVSVDVAGWAEQFAW